MLGQYAKKGQENRVPKPPTEKYSVGWFDGLIGENPQYPENSDYWSGYSLGNREYWCSKKGVTISDRF